MIILDFFVSFLKRECGNVWEGDGGDNSENKKKNGELEARETPDHDVCLVLFCSSRVTQF